MWGKKQTAEAERTDRQKRLHEKEGNKALAKERTDEALGGT